MSDTKFYLQQLRSEECACGKWTKVKMSFCARCYFSLPRDMQRDLYQRMGNGYEEAVDAAVSYLKEEGILE